MVMLALLDGDYRFLCVNVGSNGSCCDAQNINDCHVKQSVFDNTIGFPEADPLPMDDSNMPYFIAANDSFTLRTSLMKPFSGINLNNEEHIFYAFEMLVKHFK